MNIYHIYDKYVVSIAIELLVYTCNTIVYAAGIIARKNSYSKISLHMLTHLYVYHIIYIRRESANENMEIFSRNGAFTLVRV